MDNPALTAFNLFLVVFLVFMNGFFVAAEFAMVKIRSSRIQQLVSEGHRKAKFAQTLTSNLDAYLSACQLGITLSSLGLGWLGEPAIAKLLEKPLGALGVPEVLLHPIAFAIAFSIITFLHIVLGELAPKSLAIQKSEGTVLWVARPLIWFHKIMYPFIWILNGTANWMLRKAGIEPATEGELAHTEEEIRMLVNQSHKSGLIDQTEMALFDNVFEFSDRIAREIMVPRIDMVTLDIEDLTETILETIEQEQHTRYPVTQGDKDHIIGFVHVKDIWLQHRRNEPLSLQKILRKPVMVSEAAEISAVLRQMQKNRTEMAIVADEYGGTAGLITMEDIIEELVGEIQDEFDDEMAPVIKTSKGYSIEGRYLVDEVNDLLGTHLDNTDVDTIGGWLYSELGKIPAVGDTVKQEGFLFTVEKMDEHRIGRIMVERLPNEEQRSDNVEDMDIKHHVAAPGTVQTSEA
ncbi:hemolysin family protein [Effusibacillus lacus]|uniref:Membrane protein n=1 Tax=Effusibacillus lacus TaxID=1348429 RepID=A0A292YNE4_9BACL|nr:hemolysin family protein [Effusibacillus lacus]TCS68152.1 CBS domain containing-hemolysin-like protein [Effusibacillus lacus]GAX90283.1 membrane protein [Effusibacillus lacus]